MKDDLSIYYDLYMMVCTNIERMGDHLENICESVIVETAVNMNEEVEG